MYDAIVVGARRARALYRLPRASLVRRRSLVPIAFRADFSSC
jgi:hypothetical protein